MMAVKLGAWAMIVVGLCGMFLALGMAADKAGLRKAEEPPPVCRST